ncbi:MAG: hypothetical protein IT299_00955 [Dehalococcoidia bacterium]|nr:hypothetical protein [Dehalococcoidia bacterium]
MLELRELQHRHEPDQAFEDWTRMLRAACRMLVLEADTAHAVTVSATFGDRATSLEALDVAARVVEEYALTADSTLTAYVSTRISRPRDQEGPPV